LTATSTGHSSGDPAAIRMYLLHMWVRYAQDTKSISDGALTAPRGIESPARAACGTFHPPGLGSWNTMVANRPHPRFFLAPGDHPRGLRTRTPEGFYRAIFSLISVVCTLISSQETDKRPSLIPISLSLVHADSLDSNRSSQNFFGFCRIFSVAFPCSCHCANKAKSSSECNRLKIS